MSLTNPRKHQRILVVRPDRIGDVILATPLIRALHTTFPAAHIAAMVRPYTQELLLHNPHLNQVLVDDPRGAHNGRTGFLQQVKLLRECRFDTALLLLPTQRLAWMLFLAGIRTRVGVGTILYEVLTFMKTVSRKKYVPLRHEADYCLDLGRAIGVDSQDLSTELFLTDAERQAARRTLHSRPGELLVGIHPGSGHSAPNWRIERYAELASILLRNQDVRIVVTGTPQEEEFTPFFDGIGSNRITNLIGQQSLRELMATISQLHLLVSASTGPMHIAAALNVNTVSMFCPLTACSPQLWGPKGNSAQVLVAPDNYCSHKCPGDPHVCDFEGGFELGMVHDAIMRSLGTFH